MQMTASEAKKVFRKGRGCMTDAARGSTKESALGLVDGIWHLQGLTYPFFTFHIPTDLPMRTQQGAISIKRICEIFDTKKIFDATPADEILKLKLNVPDDFEHIEF
jgi:hypothetical protein